MIPERAGFRLLFPSPAGRAEMVNDPLTPLFAGLFFTIPGWLSPGCGCDSSRLGEDARRLSRLQEFLQNTAMILMIKESILFPGSRL
jgi:hypothetical protein